MREGLESSLGELSAAGNAVIVLGGVPELGFDGSKAIARHALFGLAYNAPSRLSVDRRNARANSILAAAAAQYDVPVLSIADVLCPDACLVAFEGVSLYRDDDHLSGTGAQYVIDHIMPEPLAQMQ